MGPKESNCCGLISKTVFFELLMLVILLQISWESRHQLISFKGDGMIAIEQDPIGIEREKDLKDYKWNIVMHWLEYKLGL